MKHFLSETPLDIIALTETKRNDNHIISDMPTGYNWIGKNRANGLGGGIGFLFNTATVSVNDNNLLNSMSDESERLWISVKIGKSSLALGVVYFPIDNSTNRREDATQLRDELVTNIAELQNRFDRILLVGDFNGKMSMFKNPNTNSFNGELMDTFLEATDLCLLNNSDKCTGKVTWSRGLLQSTIDYKLSIKHLFPLLNTR